MLLCNDFRISSLTAEDEKDERVKNIYNDFRIHENENVRLI